ATDSWAKDRFGAKSAVVAKNNLIVLKRVGMLNPYSQNYLFLSDQIGAISSGKRSAYVSTRSRQRRSARRLYACWRVTNDTSIISGFQARRIGFALAV
ncbi:hypothetical protein, partial [Mesorhizobium sp.]